MQSPEVCVSILLLSTYVINSFTFPPLTSVDNMQFNQTNTGQSFVSSNLQQLQQSFSDDQSWKQCSHCLWYHQVKSYTASMISPQEDKVLRNRSLKKCRLLTFVRNPHFSTPHLTIISLYQLLYLSQSPL